MFLNFIILFYISIPPIGTGLVACPSVQLILGEHFIQLKCQNCQTSEVTESSTEFEYKHKSLLLPSRMWLFICSAYNWRMNRLKLELEFEQRIFHGDQTKNLKKCQMWQISTTAIKARPEVIFLLTQFERAAVTIGNMSWNFTS